MRATTTTVLDRLKLAPVEVRLCNAHYRSARPHGTDPPLCIQNVAAAGAECAEPPRASRSEPGVRGSPKEEVIATYPPHLYWCHKPPIYTVNTVRSRGTIKTRRAVTHTPEPPQKGVATPYPYAAPPQPYPKRGVSQQNRSCRAHERTQCTASAPNKKGTSLSQPTPGVAWLCNAAVWCDTRGVVTMRSPMTMN